MHNVKVTRENIARIAARDMFYVARCSCGFEYMARGAKAVEKAVAKHTGGVVQIARRAKAVAKTAQDWYDEAHRNGWRKLGQGASRKAYDMGDGRVIKVETMMLRGQEHVRGAMFGNQCNKEAARWNAATEEQRQWLATIYEAGDGWVIMEKAQWILSDKLDQATSYSIGRDLQHETGINDLHGHNVGYFGGGRFKILDYAL